MSQDTDQDRIDVVQTCTSFGWHADHRDWDRLAGVFVDTVQYDYTSLDGGEPGPVAREAMVGAWRDRLSSMDATQHMMGSQMASVAGDTAVCTAHFQATHLRDGVNWTLGGNYRFGLVRTADGWRINAITMTAVWETGDRRAVINGLAAADAEISH